MPKEKGRYRERERIENLATRIFWINPPSHGETRLAVDAALAAFEKIEKLEKKIEELEDDSLIDFHDSLW